MNDIDIRKVEALESIKATYGTEEGEYGSTLFVSHHIEELEAEYWVKYLGTSTPKPNDVLDLLIFKSNLDDGLVFDFTLPDDVTDYVVCVSFDKSGKIEDISMES